MRQRVLRGYLAAKKAVIGAGYGDDIAWAEGLQYIVPTPEYVTREGAWVILNSGFRYAVARRLWPALTQAYRNWDPVAIGSACMEEGLRTLRHPGKLRAMVTLAEIVCCEGIERIVEEAADPPRLTRLPWIGRITCWHYAKVLGADVVKPDVHLTRAAAAAGYTDPHALCAGVRDATGDRITVVDSVLWRYGEQQLARGWNPWSALFG